MSDPDPLWLQAPCAALKLWREDGVLRWRPNAAALAWAHAHRITEAHWQQAAEQAEAIDGDGLLEIGSARLACRALPLGAARLLWLTPQPAPRAPGVLADSDKLDLLGHFLHIGSFERDAVGDQAWWDEGMFRIYGFEPAARTPGFAQTTQRIHPDDQQRVAEHRRALVELGGRHQTRFRVLLPDGSLRFLLGLTEVRDAAPGRPKTIFGVVVDETESAMLLHAHQETSTQMARALELAMVSVWRVDLKRDRIHFNDAGYRMMGMTPPPDGLALGAVRDMAHPDDRAAVMAAAEQAIASGRVIDLEARYIHPDGTYHHLLTRRVAEYDASGRAVGFAGVSFDQTERIAERDRAHALAQRIQLVADSAGVGIWSIDDGSDRVEWNAEMFRIYGLDPEQGSPPVLAWLDGCLNPQDRVRVAEERARSRRAGHADFDTQFRIIRPDGSQRWVVCRSRHDVRDGRGVTHGIHLDVTRQRLLDEQIALQEQRLKLATRSAGLGIWDRDMVSGAIVWEEQMYRLRGLEPDDPRTPQQIDRELIGDAHRAARTAAIERHLRDDQPYECEFQVRWPDGSLRWLASTGRALRDDSGKALRMVGLNWDITQRKVAEAALRDKEAAESASRAKSAFLARMSHELRTPLNAVLGFAQLLLHEARGRLDRVQLDRVQQIHVAGTRLLAMIEDVLDLSSIQAGTLQLHSAPTALHPVLLDAAQRLAALAEAREVTLQLGAGDARVLADAQRLRQVLQSLLHNAIVYNRPGGHVWAQATRMERDGVAGWSLAIRDDGRGLDAEQQAHLFEPFNRLGAERDGIDGRGLGLASAHQLVQLLHGHIDVRSERGVGSEFRVWLPAGEPNGADTLAGAALSVLYIEDNPVNAMIVRELIGMRPAMRLRCAETGGEGVRQALEDPPELILVDMHLPDMDGHEVLRRLRAQGCTARLVVLSANAMPDEVRRARATGFDDYWTKPIDFGVFLEHLDRLAGSRQSTGETLR